MIHVQPSISPVDLGIWQLGDSLHVGGGCCRNFLSDQSSSRWFVECRDCKKNYARPLFFGTDAAVKYKLDETTDTNRVASWIRAWTGLEVLVDISWF